MSFLIPVTLSLFSTIGYGEESITIDYESIESEIANELDPYDDSNWYTQKIEMIIITRDQPDEIAVMQKLADWKTSKGVPTKIVNQTEFMTYSGRDTQEKIRNCIKYYYNTYNIKWVLLAGDTNLIPIRYVYNPDTVIVPDFNEEKMGETDKPTDYYYADLTGNWDNNNNGRFGESLVYASADEIDWDPEVYVGRFPGINAAELDVMVTKTINYENATIMLGNWMNRAIFAGAIQKNPTTSDTDGEEESFLMDRIIKESIKSTMDNVTLYESNYPYANTPYYDYYLTWNSLNYWVNQGNSFVIMAGHGASTKFDRLSSGADFFTTIDAQSLTNTGMPTLFYLDACSTNFFDDDYTLSLGEALMKRDNAGAIGYIGAMRLSWFYSDSDKDWIIESDSVDDDLQSLCEMNRGMTRLFFIQMFQKGIYQQGKALFEMKRQYVNNWWWMTNNPYQLQYEMRIPGSSPYNIHCIEWERKNVLTYTLLGDPETDIYTEVPKTFLATGGQTGIFAREGGYFEGEKINLVIQDQNQFPVKGALVCVKGEDGAYNYYTTGLGGNVQIQLPKAVQTYNYTVTAHNMIPLTGSFSTKPDNIAPSLVSEPELTPNNPTVDINIRTKITAIDSESGMAKGYFVLSSDNFNTYTIITLMQKGTPNVFEGTIPKLDYGEYKFITFIFDNANNCYHTIWDSTDRFSIPFPIIGGLIIGIAGFVAVEIAIFLHKKRNILLDYERMVSNFS